MPNQSKIRLICDVIRAPKVTIDCFGGDIERNIWQGLNKRHPKLPLIRAKTFGAMLRKLPRIEEISDGSRFSFMRQQIRKAEKSGFTFKPFDPDNHFDEILATNLSSSTRQGRPISSNYTDPNQLVAYNALPGLWYGVFDTDGVLQAYTHNPIFGDSFVYSRILGNANHLNKGIMYLLVAGSLRAMALRREEYGSPNWAMYDTYIGGGDGLREFKRRTGFAPMRVKWKWIDK